MYGKTPVLGIVLMWVGAVAGGVLLFVGLSVKIGGLALTGAVILFAAIGLGFILAALETGEGE